MCKPRRVKAKITRIATEIAIVTLDRNGLVEEVEDVLDEVDCDNIELVSIQEVRDTY